MSIYRYNPLKNRGAGFLTGRTRSGQFGEGFVRRARCPLRCRRKRRSCRLHAQGAPDSRSRVKALVELDQRGPHRALPRPGWQRHPTGRARDSQVSRDPQQVGGGRGRPVERRRQFLCQGGCDGRTEDVPGPQRPSIGTSQFTPSFVGRQPGYDMVGRFRPGGADVRRMRSPSSPWRSRPRCPRAAPCPSPPPDGRRWRQTTA